MKTFLTLVGTTLFLSTVCVAATVEYQHPDLTIVAREEPLDSVLKSLGREMRIYVTIPTGLNPLVNCDIQQKPLQQAFRTLLGDMSYSLEWQENTGRLLGLTILAGAQAPAMATDFDKSPLSPGVQQSTSAPVVTSGAVEAGPPVEQSVMAAAANNIRVEIPPDEVEALMADEREVQEERLKQDVERHDTETAAYMQSQGILLLP